MIYKNAYTWKGGFRWESEEERPWVEWVGFGERASLSISILKTKNREKSWRDCCLCLAYLKSNGWGWETFFCLMFRVLSEEEIPLLESDGFGRVCFFWFLLNQANATVSIIWKLIIIKNRGNRNHIYSSRSAQRCTCHYPILSWLHYLERWFARPARLGVFFFFFFFNALFAFD